MIWTTAMNTTLHIVDLDDVNCGDSSAHPDPTIYTIAKDISFWVHEEGPRHRPFKATLVYKTAPANSCKEAYLARKPPLDNVAELSDLGAWFPFHTGTIQANTRVLDKLAGCSWYRNIRHIVIEYDVEKAFHFRKVKISDVEADVYVHIGRLPHAETMTFQSTFGLSYADIRRGSPHNHWLIVWFVLFDAWYNPVDRADRAPFRALVTGVHNAPEEEWLTPENYTQVRAAMQQQWEQLSAEDRRKHPEPMMAYRQLDWSNVLL